MSTMTQPRTPVWLAPATCALAAAALALLLQRPLAGRSAQVIPAAALFDFTFSVPLLWWWLAVKGRGASRRSLVVMFAACMLVAQFVVGDRTPVTSLWLGAVMAGLELWLLVSIALAVRSASRTPSWDFAERVQTATSKLLGQGFVARLAGDEIALLGYALTGPWQRAEQGAGRFGHQARLGRGSVVAGLIMAIALETLAVHAGLIHAHPRLAWAFTISSIWAALWLMGDYQALRLRRSSLTPEALELRVGLRARLTIPLAAISEVKSGRLGDLPRDTSLLKAYPAPASPSVLLELSRPVRVHSMYQPTRQRMRIALAPDEPAAFMEQLAAARAAAQSGVEE